MQYGTVGLAMGCAGSALVAGLTAARLAADPAFRPPPTEQPVLATGLTWAYFMAASSNARDNLVNGVEAAIAAAAPAAVKPATVALRLANNWAGARHFVAVAASVGLDRPRLEARRAVAAA